ncbi:MAG: hypothetical protein EBZ48_17660, partial [Proteobacteria bacterium]|nr:hypothetical protein [Pseudomonadota bacterium]
NDILQSLKRNMDEQLNALQLFGTDLSDGLKMGVSEGLQPSLDRIAETIDALRQHKSESLTDSLGKIIAEFKSALLGSTNSDFQTLGVTLNRTADLMSAMNEQSKLSQERMGEVIQNIDKALSRQSSAGEEQLVRLVNTMQTVIDRLEAAAERSSGSMESSVTQMLERLQVSFASQSAEMSRRNEELSGLMKVMLEQVQQSLNNLSTEVANTVSGVLDKSSELSSKTIAQFGAVLEEQTRNAQSVNGARDALNGALELFKQVVNEGSTTLKDMGAGASSLREGVSTLNSAVSNLGRSQDKVSSLAALVEKNAENLRSVIDRQDDIVTKYQTVVADLDATLSGVLTRVQSGLEDYSSGVKS